METCRLCLRPSVANSGVLSSVPNPRTCSVEDGEVCRLWQVLNRQTDALTRLKRVREDYAEGMITNGELAGEVSECVRAALDLSIPANSYFIGSWCGGEQGEYAKLFRDRERLLRERDIADRVVEVARKLGAQELQTVLAQYDRDRAPRGPLTE